VFDSRGSDARPEGISTTIHLSNAQKQVEKYHARQKFLFIRFDLELRGDKSAAALARKPRRIVQR
jgi:hypothetical protein